MVYSVSGFRHAHCRRVNMTTVLHAVDDPDPAALFRLRDGVRSSRSSDMAFQATRRIGTPRLPVGSLEQRSTFRFSWTAAN